MNSLRVLIKRNCQVKTGVVGSNPWPQQIGYVVEEVGIIVNLESAELIEQFPFVDGHIGSRITIRENLTIDVRENIDEIWSLLWTGSTEPLSAGT